MSQTGPKPGSRITCDTHFLKETIVLANESEIKIEVAISNTVGGKITQPHKKKVS